MMQNDESARNLARVTALVVAPAALAVALVAHPFISGRLPNEVGIADAVVGSTTSWGVVHIAAAVASALIAIAFLALRSYLREAGETRYSAVGVPFVVLGSTLFAVLPGMEFVPLAVTETGARTNGVAAAQSEITGWFLAVLLMSTVAFVIGVLLFAYALLVSRVANERFTLVVAVALVAMASARFVPFSAVQFYVQSLAALVAMWSLAYLMWTQPKPVRHAQPVSSSA